MHLLCTALHAVSAPSGAGCGLPYMHHGYWYMAALTPVQDYKYTMADEQGLSVNGASVAQADVPSSTGSRDPAEEAITVRHGWKLLGLPLGSATQSL